MVHETLVTPKHAIEKIHWPIYHFTANRFTGYLKRPKIIETKELQAQMTKNILAGQF